MPLGVGGGEGQHRAGGLGAGLADPAAWGHLMVNSRVCDFCPGAAITKHPTLIHPLPVPEARSPKSRCPRAGLPQKLWKDVLPASSSFGDPRPPWLVASSLRLCLVSMWPPPSASLLCLPLRRTLVVGVRDCRDSGLSEDPEPNYICKDPFSLVLGVRCKHLKRDNIDPTIIISTKKPSYVAQSSCTAFLPRALPPV